MITTFDNTDALVRTLLRTIDKRAEYSVEPIEGDASRTNINLSLGKRKATVSFRVDDLSAAEQDLMRRNQVRTALKRAIDAMMFRSTPIVSTAMLRPDSQAEGFFRSPFSGKRR